MASIVSLTQAAKEHLEEDERVHAVVLGAYEIEIMGKDSLRNGILLATDKRVVFYGKKMFGYDMEVFSYSNISSIETGKGMLGHSINLFASGNKVKMKWIKKGEINEFVNYVKQNIGKPISLSQHSASESDIPDQIKKLAELKEQGILTEEEFQSKKKDLLSKL